MSLRSLFKNQASRLLNRRWRNSETQLLAEEMYAVLTDDSPLRAYQPIIIENFTRDQPAIRVIDRGGSNQGYEVVNSYGQLSRQGIGLQSVGLVASEMLPDPTFFVCRSDSTSEIANSGGVSERDYEQPADYVRHSLFSREDQNLTGYVLPSGATIRCEGSGTGVPGGFPGGENTVSPAGSAGQFFHEMQTHMTDGGGGGGTNPYSFNGLSPLNTKGDILTHDGTENVRVPVGTDGQVLTADSTDDNGVVWETPGGGGGVGDVSGPASSTDNAIARFDGTTGKIIQNSGALVADNGQVQGPTSPPDGRPQFSTIGGATTGLLMGVGSSGSANDIGLVVSGTERASVFTSSGKAVFGVNGLFRFSNGTDTISSGEIEPIQSYVVVDTESSAASDDLDTINIGSSVPGVFIVIRAADSARTVVCKDGTGNLKLNGDCTLDNVEDTLFLIYDGSNWLEISRSDNGA